MNHFNALSSQVKGTTLIEASAGTGKTFSMALLMLRFLLNGSKIEEILAVTFTRAATSELKDRIRKFVDEAVRFLETNPTPTSATATSPVEKMVASFVGKEGLLQSYRRLKLAYANIDTASIFTIHAFCQRIIQEYAFETATPYGLELVEDGSEISLEIAQNYWLTTLLTPKTPRSFISHITQNLSPVKLLEYLRQWHKSGSISDPPRSEIFSWEETQTAESFDLIADTRLFIYRFLRLYPDQFETRNRELGKMTYDSLISILSDTLKKSETKEFLTKAVRKRFKVALIDEFQDTDSEQYNIFSTFFGDETRPLICIGDPKQAIYSFRKADLHTYLYATAKERLTQRYSLGLNWRSSDKMVTAVNRFFTKSTAKVDHPFIIPEIAFSEVEPSHTIAPLTIAGEEATPLVISFLAAKSVGKHHLSRSQDIKVSGKSYLAQYVASEILFLLNPQTEAEKKPGKPVTPSDIAILVASHKEGELFKNALSEHNIPASIQHQTSVFQTQIGQELWVVLTAIIERSYGVMKAAIITDIINGTLQEEDSFLEKFYDWWIEWREKGFLAAFTKMSTDTDMRRRLATRQDGERVLTDIRHLSETLHAKEWSAKLTPYELLQWFGQMISSSKKSDAAQLRMDSDEKAVSIVTLHSAKGLQWPIVFLPTLFSSAELFRGQKSGRYHDGEGENHYHYLAPAEKWPSPIKKAIEEERLAEKIRLLYVGMTRAEKRCYLMTGRFNTLGSSPLGYLMHGMRSFFDLKKLSDDDLIDDVNQFAEAGVISSISPKNTTKKSPFVITQKPIDKTAKEFSRAIDPSWAITSYSALTSHRNEEQDFDYFLYKPQEKDKSDSIESPEPIFTFPAGPRAGTALHKVFESIDFTDSSCFNGAIESVLSSFSLLTDAEGNSHQQTIFEMVTAVLETELPHGPRLAEIPTQKCVQEMEFFFPFEKIDSEQLMATISDDMTHISFKTVQGFLHGFIDLVFQHENKFYIVDWKSNLLGKEVDSYTQPHLKEAMADHNYRLQYLLYTVALHRWLELTIDDYDYETHFGGAYYLFLRGVRVGKTTGIWYEKPEKQLIDRINTLLRGEK